VEVEKIDSCQKTHTKVAVVYVAEPKLPHSRLDAAFEYDRVSEVLGAGSHPEAPHIARELEDRA
jgi:hypothetical protein